MSSVLRYVRGLRYDFPRGVYVLQAGLVINAFGNGAANPFVLLYLHNVRGIHLAVAGLVAATSATCALAGSLLSGSSADRRGAVPTMVGGLVCSAAGFALYPLVREPWQAFGAAALTGTGVGVWLTMQSNVLAQVTPPDVRHAAFAQQRVAANIGLGLGGFVGGLIVTVGQPATFTVLFLLNATTFLVYTAFLIELRLPRPTRSVEAARGRSYRGVLRDGAFTRFTALNLVVVIGAISLLNSVFPVYARDDADVSETTIGALFLFNSVTIIIGQMPVARAVEGRRRMAAFALMGALFAVCWVEIGLASSVNATSLTILALAAGVFTMSLAECVHAAVQGPLAADLAPAGLLGRYMAVMGLSWQVGFIVGPALGAALLAAQPALIWYVMATLCSAAGAYALRLERRLPEHVRRTPQPVRVQGKA